MDSYWEGLEILIKDLNIEVLGFFFFECNCIDIVDLLVICLCVNNYLIKWFELFECFVVKLIFVFGVFCIGIILFSNLLVVDFVYCFFLIWEIEDLVLLFFIEIFYIDLWVLSCLEEECKFLESVL